MNRRLCGGVFLAIIVLLSPRVIANEYYPAFLVLRYYADGSEQERARLKEDHHDYYLRHGRDAVSFRIFDDQGQSTGRGSWMAFESQEAAEKFVDNDPYRQANLYREISVDRANIYFLDQWFSISPPWRNAAEIEAAHDRYDEHIKRKPVPPR